MSYEYVLSFEHVTAGYQYGQVLHDISAQFLPGHISALIGPNGAGKSTLIRVASGILVPEVGEVKVNGLNVSRLDSATRAKLISVIPQARNLPPAFTVREVVTMGRTAYSGWFGNFSKEDDDIVHHALQRTDTLTLADRRMGELSGGEAQRVLVARAIAQQARVMLLDEPTAHLDIHYQLSVLDLLQGLAGEDQLVVLVAIHDLNMVARYADQILLMVDGRCVAAGSRDEVLKADILSAGYQVRMQVFQPADVQYPVIIPIN